VANKKVFFPANFFLEREVGWNLEDLENWLGIFKEAKVLGEFRTGGNNTNVFTEGDTVYISFLGGGIEEIMSLEQILSIIEYRLDILRKTLAKNTN
jgi:hypothetical protein